MAEVVVAASHEVGDATAGADARHHASAEGAESAQALLDVDSREVAEREGTDKFFLGILVFLGKDYHGVGGTDALVARTAVAHHGYHGASHTCIARQRSLGYDVREHGVAKDTMAQRTIHGLAQTVAVVALDGLFGCAHVEVAGLEDKLQLVDGGGKGRASY